MMFQSSIAPKGNRYFLDIHFFQAILVPILDRPERQSLPVVIGDGIGGGRSNPRSPRKAIATCASC